MLMRVTDWVTRVVVSPLHLGLLGVTALPPWWRDVAGGRRDRYISLPCSYYLGVAHENLVCQDSSTGFYKTFSPSPSTVSYTHLTLPTNSLV